MLFAGMFWALFDLGGRGGGMFLGVLLARKPNPSRP